MLLSFDVVPEAIPEHDDWHTHEHLPERLSIPGFLRGSRWIAVRGQPRYLVLYEVADLGTLTSPAYLERLNNPSAWTAKMMPHYRGMRRGLCTVVGSFGLGMGHLAFAILFSADEARRSWLVKEALPPLPARRGIGSVHLLQGAAAAQMTREQSIRGADTGVDLALLLMGYDADALSTAAGNMPGPGHLYRLDYTLSADEVQR